MKKAYHCKQCKDRGTYLTPGKRIRVQRFCDCPVGENLKSTIGRIDMGEISYDVVNGFYCEECGQYIDGEEPGYPRRCDDCKIKEAKCQD